MAIANVDMADVLRAFDAAEHRQMPFAAATTLTRLARLARDAEAAEIVRVFDNPVPFTRNAVGMSGATKASLESLVFIKDRQAQYLAPEVEGGQREIKPFERLFGKGITVPSVGARLNQYGNVTRAAIKRIAEDLRRTDGKGRYFMGKPLNSNLPAGIYDRGPGKGRALRPVLIFAREASYSPRLRFERVARETATAAFEREMLAAWQQALATAR